MSPGLLILACFLVSLLGSGVVVAVSKASADIKTVNTTTKQVVSSEGDLIAKIAKDVGASTVSITTEGTTTQGLYGQPSGTEQGAGTGIIISKDGYIMTNRHVVPDGTQTVNVTLSDGTKYNNVTVIGRDKLNDIAFIKIDKPNKALPAATIADSSKVQVGEKVVAVGNALGQFQNTVTSGIISGIGRPITAGGNGEATEQLTNLFQTDAAINPGNSGGPLVNMAGEVIGMNTAVASGAQGIGFAIPVNDATGLIKSVTQQGKLVRPFLGVRTVSLTPAIAKQLNAAADAGAYISNQEGVVAGSPAEKAGLRSGDIITKVNDDTVTVNSPISSLIAKYAVGDEVTLTVIRDGKTTTIKATLAES